MEKMAKKLRSKERVKRKKTASTSTTLKILQREGYAGFKLKVVTRSTCSTTMETSTTCRASSSEPRAKRTKTRMNKLNPRKSEL